MMREALGLLIAFALTGCTSGGSGASRSAADEGTTASASPRTPRASTVRCRTTYPPKVLPRWARAGFSGPNPTVPYVLSESRDKAAIVWVSHHPLAAPPVTGEQNKILWVARVGATAGPLQIQASLQGTGQTVTRIVDPAPGPSVVDLPSPGCWSFDLTWGSHHDRLQLGYASG